MSQDQPFIWKSIFSGPVSWVEQSLWDLEGGKNSVSQVDGVSYMAPACQLCGCVQGGFRKGTMTSAYLDARHFSSSLYATGAFQGATLVLELIGSESE